MLEESIVPCCGPKCDAVGKCAAAVNAAAAAVAVAGGAVAADALPAAAALELPVPESEVRFCVSRVASAAALLWPAPMVPPSADEAELLVVAAGAPGMAAGGGMAAASAPASACSRNASALDAGSVAGIVWRPAGSVHLRPAPATWERPHRSSRCHPPVSLRVTGRALRKSRWFRKPPRPLPRIEWRRLWRHRCRRILASPSACFAGRSHCHWCPCPGLWSGRKRACPPASLMAKIRRPRVSCLLARWTLFPRRRSPEFRSWMSRLQVSPQRSARHRILASARGRSGRRRHRRYP